MSPPWYVQFIGQAIRRPTVFISISTARRYPSGRGACHIHGNAWLGPTLVRCFLIRWRTMSTHVKFRRIHTAVTPGFDSHVVMPLILSIYSGQAVSASFGSLDCDRRRRWLSAHGRGVQHSVYFPCRHRPHSKLPICYGGTYNPRGHHAQTLIRQW